MNVFDLFAKISLDTSDYEKDLKGAQSSFSKFGDGLKSAAGKLGDVLAGIGKTAAVGIGAAGTALTALTKQSLGAVANYEQLVGGVDKIFGESSKKVQEYANQAFLTSGLSANQYMETVTGFSASLLQSLEGNTEKAADTANRAIIDMADNMNTYGSNMDSVMNAYQGFSKQNYTMLDNLKLGYGGTKEEMYRLIQDASKMNEEMQALGVTIDADSMSFGNIINAISVMQRHLKISGTTAKEAGGTISGSIASMKAAWQNFLTGTGSTAQFTKVLKDAVSNIRKNLKDVIPRLTVGLQEITGQLAPEIPAIIKQTLPAIITGASDLITGLATRLPNLITAILPSLVKGVVDVTTSLVGVLPNLITSLKKSIPIVVRTIMSKKDDLLKAGKDMIAALTPKDFKGLVNQGSEAVKSFIDGALSPDSINNLLDGAGKIIENLVDGIKTVLLGGEQDGEGGIFGAAKEIIIKIGDYFADEKNRQNFIENADKIIYGLGKAIISVLQNGVAPLMVEAARTWMEVFIGEINYTDAANDIIKRLGEAFLHNMLTGGILGQWIDSAAEDYLNEEVDPNIGYQPSTDYYTTEGMIAAGALQGAALNAYNSARGYNSFYSDVPRAITNNSSIGDNVTNITINATSDRAEDIRDAVVSAMDEKLAQRQALQNRGYGYVGV